MKNKYINIVKKFISPKRTQLVILVMTIVLANSIFIVWYFPENFKQASLQRAESETLNISKLTQNAVASAVYFNDLDEIKNSLKATFNLPNYQSLVICDTLFNITTAFHERYPIAIKKLGLVNYYDSSFIRSTIPIKYKNILIGYLTLKLSLSSIKKDVHEAQLNALFISLVSLIIGIIFTVLISRVFTKPLQKLKSVFTEIARMNLAKRAYIPGDNEFTSLAESFNMMVDKLDKAYSEITEININLEKRVEERTVSLYDEIEVRKLAQANLLKMNQLLTEIINASPLPILSIDTLGYIKSFSPAYRNLLGLNSDQSIDKHPDFKNMYELNKYFDSINFAISERKPQLFSSILTTTSKEEKNIQFHISPIINNDNNEATSLIVIMEDITDRIIKEQALLESEEKYRTLIDTSQIGIGIFRDNTCIFANNSLLEIWGFSTLSELENASPNDYIISKDQFELSELFDKETAINQKMEIQYKAKNGVIGYVEATKTPIIYRNEKLIQIAFLDISDRVKSEEAVKVLNQELEQRVLERTSMLNDALVELKNENKERQKVEEKLRLSDQILQRVGTLVLVADKNTNIIYVSPYVKTLLGYEVEEIIGDKWWNITSKNTQDKEKQREYIRKCINEEIRPNEKPYERSIYTKDGAKKWIQWQDVLGDGNTVIGVGNDITEKIIVGQKLKEARIELEKTLERERELGELKTKFISMISHEYRTPLTVILSSANIIAKLIERNETDRTNNFIKKIELSVQSMVKLLEDVLIIGKSEAGAFKIELRVIDLEFITADIIEDLRSAHKYSNEIDLQFNGNFKSMTADEKFMRQILSNIISNALKYSPNNSPVHIKFDLHNEFYQIEVADSGIGMSENDLAHLFDSFYRGNNVGTISGTGLGMPILKRCVDMLNGTIDVQSKINQGTIFRITLPNLNNM